MEHKRTKLNICHHMLTSSPQLQNRKNENVFKMSKDEKCTCKACKDTVFHCQICKFVGFLLPSSSWLLKLPIFTVTANSFDELKWYCDENHIFPIEPILKHKQVACMTRKLLFTIFKYLFLFHRYSNF